MAKSAHIFSNGTEYQMWEARNCGQCPHSCYNNGQGESEFPNCKIEAALMLGEVTCRQRWFAGYEVPGDCTTWRCRYRQQMDKREVRQKQQNVQAAVKELRTEDKDAIRYFWVQP